MHGVVDALRRCCLGAKPSPLPSAEHRDLLARVLSIAAAQQHEGATTLQSARAAHAICACLDPTHGRRRVSPAHALHPAGATALPRAIDARPGAFADTVTPDGTIAPGDAPAGAWGDASAFEADVGKSVAAPAPRSPRNGPKAIATAPGRSFFYDEWDSIHQRYLPDWCHVHERRLRGDDLRFLVSASSRST